MTIRMMPTMPAGFITASLQRTAALDQIDNQHYDGKHKQEVNEPAQGIGADQSKQPENQQNHKDCPQHRFPFG
jgi:hypothetical protein